jgi:hypothetical protein
MLVTMLNGILVSTGTLHKDWQVCIGMKARRSEGKSSCGEVLGMYIISEVQVQAYPASCHLTVTHAFYAEMGEFSHGSELAEPRYLDVEMREMLITSDPCSLSLDATISKEEIEDKGKAHVFREDRFSHSNHLAGAQIYCESRPTSPHVHP